MCILNISLPIYHSSIMILASRSSSLPTSLTVLAQRISRKFTRMHTPPSVRIPPSSPPKSPRTGKWSARSSRLPVSRTPNARNASRRRSRPSRPTVVLRRRQRRRKRTRTRSKRLAPRMFFHFVDCCYVYSPIALHCFMTQKTGYVLCHHIPHPLNFVRKSVML